MYSAHTIHVPILPYCLGTPRHFLFNITTRTRAIINQLPLRNRIGCKIVSVRRSYRFIICKQTKCSETNSYLQQKHKKNTFSHTIRVKTESYVGWVLSRIRSILKSNVSHRPTDRSTRGQNCRTDSFHVFLGEWLKYLLWVGALNVSSARRREKKRRTPTPRAFFVLRDEITVMGVLNFKETIKYVFYS